MSREIPSEEVAGSVPGEGLSRRDLLKYGAAVGAVTGSVPAGLAVAPDVTTIAQAAAMRDVSLANGAVLFAVDIPGCPVASANIVSVDVDDLSIDIRELTTGHDVEYRVYAPGDAHYGNATFKCRVGTQTLELRQWLEDAAGGRNVRKSISVICLKRDHSEVLRYNLIDCFPVKWDPGDYSPSSTIAVESMRVKLGRIEFKV